MICSDGFRKMVTDDEIKQNLLPSANTDRETLKSNLEYLLDLNMKRNEGDNITALAVRYTV